MQKPSAAAHVVPTLIGEAGCNIRIPPPPELLDPDMAQRISGQEAALRGVLRGVLGIMGLPMPHADHRARVVPPAWWRSTAVLGGCSAWGRIVMIFCGSEGLPLNHVAGEGHDFRFRGLSAKAWATVATHEALHAAANIEMGIGAAAASMIDPARGIGEEPEDFAAFVREFHHLFTGKPLPPDYAADRWPEDAPGLDVWLTFVASHVGQFAIAPAGRNVSPEAFHAAWVAEGQFDIWEEDNLRIAAAEWRAARERAA